MSVNKVGRTLLLDKFDVEKLLSQAAQVSTRVAEQCVGGGGGAGGAVATQYFWRVG